MRSSANAEDLPGMSFAGQRYTRMNVHGIDTLDGYLQFDNSETMGYSPLRKKGQAPQCPQKECTCRGEERLEPDFLVVGPAHLQYSIDRILSRLGPR